MSSTRDDEKLLLGSSELPTAHTRQPQQGHSAWGLVRKVFKAVFALVATLLVIAICAYTGSKLLYGKTPCWPGRDGSMSNYDTNDCRSSGCHDGFTCAPVNAHVACFVGPCPSTLYECIPSAMVGMPDSSQVSILPISAENSPIMAQASPESPAPLPEGDQRITEAFYSCVQKHGGQTSWTHPIDGCNTCKCTLSGSVACTKMFCSPVNQNDDAVSRAINQVSDVHTTVMVPLASASGEAKSALYTSVPIDIEA
ncbi:hypothetical protein IWW36_003003 [Coemansia brasiliensis]|uniref:Pacifastin domain-containing protein n=1 Tax=Coemansia brasiliensis TaxID=2650707 RepID=A0A9W8ICG1_9FUNG|nr:hypothetical protein IWW36_003003 [Coemansia brasiliensis]